jgi:hypothetical protein
MRTWMRSVVDATLGAVRGKNGQINPATRTAMTDADFRDRRETKPPRKSERKREEVRRPRRPF